MSIESYEDGLPACKAVELEEFVDMRLNVGAIREFEAATSYLQEPSADSEVGSPYLDSRVVAFTPRSVKCDRCDGAVGLTKEGSVVANNCPSSGSCELQWSKECPESYRDGHALTAAKVVCRAAVGCLAQLKVSEKDGALNFTIVKGSCAVDGKGPGWKERGAQDWHEADLWAPQRGIKEFDGVDSGRELEE